MLLYLCTGVSLNPQACGDQLSMTFHCCIELTHSRKGIWMAAYMGGGTEK